MTGMENKQPVNTSSSVSAARETQSTTPPLGQGRSVAFPPPELEIVPIAATPVPESELTVEVGDCLTTGHLEETVCISLTIITRTVQPTTLGGDQQTTIFHHTSPNKSHLLQRLI